MKLFKSVESNRMDYHKNAMKNTINKGSLLVPRIKGYTTVISFLNHFLIRRKNLNVCCKMTAINKSGIYLDSFTYTINEPIVYEFNLEEIFSSQEEINIYNIEFYSSNNLFIPYPAVIINHLGKDCINTIHSYARILNDIFEDRSINEIHVEEASIDCLVNDDFDTLLYFIAGPLADSSPSSQSIFFKLAMDDQLYHKEIKLDSIALTGREVYLSEIFPNLKNISNSFLKILQPKHKLFYGRIFAGITLKNSNSISANHSFYNTTEIPEYFNNILSSKVFPYFSEYDNEIVIYPIMSKGTYSISIEFCINDTISKSSSLSIKSPSNSPLVININSIAKECNIENITTYRVIAQSKDKIPTRFTFQLRHRILNSQNPIQSSVSVGLTNEEVFIPPYKNSFIWGQLINDVDYLPNLGICFETKFDGLEEITISFYDKNGLISERTHQVASQEAIIFDCNNLPDFKNKGKYIWYVAKSKKPELSAHYFHVNTKSGYASGEHSF